MPEPDTKSAAVNYATRDNIVFPGTREQADDVERQAAEQRSEVHAFDADADQVRVESDQALEVELAVRDRLASEEAVVTEARESNEEARADHGSVTPEQADLNSDIQRDSVERTVEVNESAREDAQPPESPPSDTPVEAEQPVTPQAREDADPDSPPAEDPDAEPAQPPVE